MIWEKVNGQQKINGDYKALHEALLRFKEHVDTHPDEDISFRMEVISIMNAFDSYDTKEFIIVHADDYLDYKTKYCVIFDNDFLSWNLPGDLEGSIMF